MLEKMDLSKKISKEKYKEQIEDLKIEAAKLQREAKDLGIPIILVFEGWDAAGKGTVINQLLMAMDPRGFKVHSIIEEEREEKLKAPMWRFWTKLPAKGRIVVFDKSWYERVLEQRVDKQIKKKELKTVFKEIKSFERQLSDDGNVILKFFLHIDKKEQKRRFKKLESNSATAWKVSKQDWKNHKHYEKFYEAVEDMVNKTDFNYSAWNLIESMDKRYATIQVFKKMIQTFKNAIESKKNEKDAQEKKATNRNEGSIESSILKEVDLSLSLSKEKYDEKIDKYQHRLRELEHELFKKRISLVLAFEGWDAAGKGGAIKRLVKEMDPRGYEVIPVAAPNDIEKKHHYLWRFWQNFPKAGHITIFDRTWYGRVLVERVEGFCSTWEWSRAYKEINEMEEQLYASSSIVIKFWLQISKEEQLKRFQERENTPHKKWKITEEDWRNREKWDLYEQAVEEMIFRTDTPHAPWVVVEAENKRFARIKVLKTVIDAIEKRLSE